MPDLLLDESLASDYELMLKRVEEGYPIQYILGEWEFYGRSFYVEEGVLIPRPETELLVEQVLRRLPEDKNIRGFEIGVGTGCISITLLLERKKLLMFGNDINLKALKLSKKNALRHGVYDRMFLFAGDAFSAIKKVLFDFIVSNPPYIPQARWEDLPKSVRLEGYRSLIGGKRGVEFYELVSEDMDMYLSRDGFFAFEIGHDQGPEVRHIFERKGFKVEVIKDYAGQDRMVVGWRC